MSSTPTLRRRVTRLLDRERAALQAFLATATLDEQMALLETLSAVRRMPALPPCHPSQLPPHERIAFATELQRCAADNSTPEAETHFARAIWRLQRRRRLCQR
jgi:hypothetical protein